MLVKVNVFIMSTWKGVQWSIWLYSFGAGAATFKGGLLNQSKFYVDVVVLLGWNASYMALYDLGYSLDNPFKNRSIDVPHEVIGAGLRRLMENLTEGSAVLPPCMTQKQLLKAGRESEEGEAKEKRK